MATTVAAMKGKLGSTEYFILSMKAKELVEKASIPKELPGWDNLALEEREQREINYTRVRNQIAPYLASDKDRFFGAIILAAINFDANSFEPIADVATKGLPNLYKTQAKLMGFLTFTGGEVLVPIDGQHRLKAIQFAIEGKDEKNRPISGLEPCSALADEDVTVILVSYDKKRSRKIFSRVNRYARPTSTGQNLVTDDDDIIAVLSRFVANEIIGAHLVNYKTNTLSDKSGQFTALATIAECNEAILDSNFPDGKIDRTKLPDVSRQALYKDKIREIWGFLVANIDLFDNALTDKEESGDEKRREIRGDYLLGKPVPQACLVKAFARLTAPDTNFTYQQAAEKLNSVNWLKDVSHWDRLFISGGKIITKNKKLVTDILYYCADGNLDQQKQQELLDKFRDLFPEDKKSEISQLPKLIK